MTVFENLKSMNIDKLSEWIDKHGEFDNSPWIIQFDKNYCSKCESVKGRYEDSERELDFCWCEIYNKCKFFQDIDSVPDTKQMIKLWLESEV